MSDFDGATLERIDELVAAADVPGVVTAVARGETVHVSVAGKTSIDGPDLKRDSLFRISSMTKPLTAVAVLSLIEDGLLELDGSVEQLLPELAGRRVLRRPDGPLGDTVPAERAITTRDLLTFTWGFGMQGAMAMAPEPWPILTATIERDLAALTEPRPGSVPEQDTWLARFAELPLLAQPGERWLYSTGSQVLGILASRAAQAPFSDVLRERVTGPLGMRDTEFWAREPSRLVTAYSLRDGELTVTDPPDGQWASEPAFADGAAGLVSTVDDYVLFARALLRSDILTPEWVAELTRDQLTAGQRAKVWPGFSFLDDRGWGYGVSVAADGSYGWDGGLGTSWTNAPDEDLTVLVLTQRDYAETGPPAVCAEVLAAARASR